MSQADPASRAGASAAPSPLDCLAGGGEMGALMRSFDWTRTKLGPVASWPQSLRTAVSIMLDSAFGMVVAWGPEFIFLYNDRYRPVLGATKHPSAMGKRTCDVFPEVWDFVGPLFEKTRRGESVALDDVLLPLDRNGYLENCYFTLSYSPIRDESGGVGGMLAVVAETTQRVEGERRLRTLRNLAALAEARSADEACVHAEAVLSANRDDVPFSLLYLLDTDGRRARLAGVTGLGRDADAAPAVVALDGDDAWQLGVCNRTRQAVVLTDLASRFGPMPGGPCEEPAHTAMVLPMVRAGHDRLHGFFVAGVSPRRALDERYRTFFELGRDHIVAAIANALAYEEERQRAEALAAIDRAKTAFFSNVSHEFRTPLTLMLGPTEDALGSPERALGGESLETVHRNELRLLKLVNTLLDFSRIEAGRVQARFEPTDLGAVTSDLASAFRSAVERAGLRYEVECDRIEEPIYVDHGMWEKIVLNLLSNAFKFTFEGGIRVALRGDGDGVELSVADSGVGIPGEALPHVFERFRRVEGTRSRTHEGSGIGLALVHDLVKLHGGHVRVTSEVDRGTTFAVRIPKGKTHLPAEQVGTEPQLASTAVGAEAFVAEALRWLPDEPSAPVEARAMASGPSAPSSSRVLVVDDNADMRDYIARLLRQRFTVALAANGDEALALARKERPDLVLTDVMMPGLDGFGLLRALRKDEQTKTIPVILLSARAGEESRLEGLHAGADDYLIKPFSARELMARVATHLELSRLRREAELQHKKLYSLFEQAPAVICVLSGPDHVYRLANPSYLEAVGNRPVLGRPIREALPELEGSGIYELLDHAFTTGERVVRADVPLKLERNGALEDTYWSFSYQPYRAGDGHVEGIMVFGFDVTRQVVARQQAEALTQKVRASEEALRESERQFRTLADTVPLLAWYANPDGYIPWYNRRWYEYTGTTPEQQEGWQWQSVHDPNDLPRVVAKWKAALASGEPWEDQFRLRRHDGEFRWFLSRALPLRDGQGRIVRWFGTNVDIDDQKRAEAAAEAASRAKDEFLAVLGHELRNPLAPIVTAIHLMRLRDGDRHAKERTIIERQAQHLVRLVDDLLDVSRITRGKVELKKQRIELAEVVASAIETATPLLEQRQHDLVVEVAPKGLTVDGDPARLAQVVANLLTNAAKYTESRGRVTMSATRDGGEVVLRVRDTGIGIAPEILPTIFDMFVQERQALDRSQGGLGLGLTIVRSLVRLHGGTIEAHSAGRHRGAEFVVRLPAAPEHADEARPVTAADVAPRADVDRQRVLVVDDNDDAADLLSASLEAMGHRTRVAHDGPSALKVLEEFSPDVALLDIGLPVMDGYELARRLRERTGGRPLRLVAITGYGQVADRHKSEEAGFSAHLVKPIDIDRLQSVIQESAPRPL